MMLSDGLAAEVKNGPPVSNAPKSIGRKYESLIYHQFSGYAIVASVDIENGIESLRWPICVFIRSDWG